MDLTSLVAIAGVGTASPADPGSPKTNMALHLEAAHAAIEDAGLTTHDIDSIITGDIGGYGPRLHIEMAELMGIPCTTLSGNFPAGGGTALAYSLAAARWAVWSGTARHVLVVSALTAANPYLDVEPQPPEGYRSDRFFGPTTHTYLGTVAHRYLHERGLGSDAFGRVAVALRANALRNPDAAVRDPLSVDEAAASPVVSSPLCEIDIARPADGGAAIVVTTSERAADLRCPVVTVEGYGHATGPYTMERRARSARGIARTVTRRAGKDALAEAQVAVGDLAFVQVHDEATVLALIGLEDLGVCAEGESPGLFGEGRSDPGGTLPINTDGGTLNGRGPSGFSQLLEAVRQLRGECEGRQVPGASVGAFTCLSATMSSAGVGILARR